MKTSGDGALITPASEGWSVAHRGGTQRYASLAEAAAALPVKGHVHLALPCHAALLERMTLPSTDRAELSGMLQLQLEKSLPYPLAEISSDFEVISAKENAATLLAVTAHSGQLDAICTPLRARERLPERITLFAMHVASSCPAGETVLIIYPEQGHWVAAIAENGRLSWAQALTGLDVDELANGLPTLLLSAEMEGVPTNFTSVWLDREMAAAEAALQSALGLPVTLINLDQLPEPKMNLVPSAWHADLRRIERSERVKQRLFIAAIAYLLAVGGAFVYLALLKREAQTSALQVAAAQPQIESIIAAQTRWNQLRPAFDPQVFVVETLYEAYKNLPTQEVRITDFAQSPRKWTIVGEAPSANLAIEYSDKMKAESGLEAWQITSAAPVILQNAAKFNLEGRL